MIVTGGVYGERCIWPHRDDKIYGSGGRAAAAIANIADDLLLASYCPPQWVADVAASAAALNYQIDLKPSPECINFTYLHPLSKPDCAQLDEHNRKSAMASDIIEADDDVVLRFDMIEGQAKVRASRAVFDPQTGGVKNHFIENGSVADELTVVLNEDDAYQATRVGPWAAGPKIQREWNAKNVVIKRGWRGALVFAGDQTPVEVPAFKSTSVYKIGSGDVFSAFFTHFWGNERADPIEAAQMASRAVSRYVDTRTLPVVLPDDFHPEPFVWQKPRKRPYIYLAGPFFNLAQRWLVEEAHTQFDRLGVDVFSPFHDVGRAIDNTNVASEDLQGLKDVDVILALCNDVDIGTIFEIGFAKGNPKQPKPVVIYSETMPDSQKTMLTGTSCEIVPDFCSAIYRSIWAAS